VNTKKMSLFIVCLFAIAAAAGIVILGLMIWVLESPPRDEEHPPRGYPK
jgi:hypothetical protein